MFCNCSVKGNRMGTAFDETRKFLIRKCLGIDQAADSERGSKNMNFLYFSGFYIREQFRLVTDQSMYIFSPGLRFTAIEI